MKNYSYRGVLIFSAGVCLSVFGCLYFFGVSAQTEKNAPPTENLTLGRVAFQRLTGSAGGFNGSIDSVNADGTGYGTMSNAGAFIPIQPAWSPDGTQVVYSAQGVIWIGSTNTGAAGNDPTWSPSGKIPFTLGAQIWRMNADET